MKQFVTYLAVISFISYWGITILFNLPDNYIKILLDKEETYFRSFFFQNWQFFAPPPDYNERLYYTFINPNQSDISFEVLQPVFIQKRQDAPFNFSANKLDYILSNSVNGVNDHIGEAMKIRKYQKEHLKSFPDLPNDTLFEQNKNKHIHNLSSFKVLERYASEVAKKNKVQLSHDTRVVITIGKIPIPRFHLRKADTTEKIIQIWFASDSLKLN